MGPNMGPNMGSNIQTVNMAVTDKNKNPPFETTGHGASCPEAHLWPTDI